MEEVPKKFRRNSVAQIKLNKIRDTIKCSLSIQPFSAGVKREHSFSCEIPILENEREHTPDRLIQTNSFANFYEEVKYIGQGGQSIIKKIKRTSDNKIFAVKIYKLKSLDDYECMNAILKEFLNSKTLVHANIMKVYELFADEKKNEVRIVTEYLKMKSLDHLLKKKHIFSEKEVSNIIFQVLNALIYMHSKGICHRDINPSNIMYDLESKLVKIIDFGISKNFSEIFRKHRKFIKKSVSMYSSVGTMAYNAPEMLSGEGYSFDVDLWSVGVVTYQLLCGSLPFYSEYSGILIELITECKLEFPLDSNFSVISKDFCKRLLRKSCQERLIAEDAMKHPFILLHNKNLSESWGGCDLQFEVNGGPHKLRKIDRFRTQILDNLEKNCLSATKPKKQGESLDPENNKLIKSLKKFSSKTPKKKIPIMMIKNFPPFLLDKDFKNFEQLPLCFKALKSALSIDETYEMKGKEESKKMEWIEKGQDSQNLITSNFLI